VNQTAVVHCGFHSENGGFKISDEDKRYMQSCKIVVSTCAFGGGDDLYQPIGMSESSLTKVVTLNEKVRHVLVWSLFLPTCLTVCFGMQVCYVAFWDEITLRTQESDGHRIGEDHMIGKWRIVVVKQLPFVDQRLNGKIPKVIKDAKLPFFFERCFPSELHKIILFIPYLMGQYLSIRNSFEAINLLCCISFVCLYFRI
jgi:hypothetical protein